MPSPLRFLLPVLAATAAAAAPAPAGVGVTPPRDVIIFIADGWGFAHVAAAGLYAHGRAGGFVWDGFPARLSMTTGSRGADGPVTDSAAAATAMSTGCKSRNGALGIDATGDRAEHLLEVARQSGRATGVVTTVPLCHATPAGFVVHAPSRDDYAGIAREMLESTGLAVIMGGGHPWFDRDGARRDRPRTFRFVGGESLWDSLAAGLAGNDADGDGTRDLWTLVDTRDGFRALREGVAPRRVLGVAPVAETLQQERQGDTDAAPYAAPLTATVPDLATMALGALNVLDADPDGLALVIEGGAVDWAGHDQQSGRMIEELLAFHDAVAEVLAWLDRTGRREAALVIVTGDHETGGLELAANAGARSRAGRLPAMRWTSTGHTASPVPFFATGPGSEDFTARGRAADGSPGTIIDNTDLGGVVKRLLR